MKIKKNVCTTARIQKATVSFVKNVDWKKVATGALVASAVVVATTEGLAAVAVVSALNLACGSQGAYGGRLCTGQQGQAAPGRRDSD